MGHHRSAGRARWIAMSSAAVAVGHHDARPFTDSLVSAQRQPIQVEATPVITDG